MIISVEKFNEFQGTYRAALNSYPYHAYCPIHSTSKSPYEIPFGVYNQINPTEMVGELLLQINGEDCACITSFFILESFRGKGLGTRLLKETIKVCEDNEIKLLSIETHREKAITCLLTGFGLKEVESDDESYTSFLREIS